VGSLEEGVHHVDGVICGPPIASEGNKSPCSHHALEWSALEALLASEENKVRLAADYVVDHSSSCKAHKEQTSF